ncbi:unnamed protein product [Phaedon cochleariae]|uniref:Serine/threonine-protein kinase 11-interacting protein n=1 Tax=Phaedon cochleariae TaxID=80249 RepID=A0A9N9SJY3_PHACE|nr:unnamed protein product [Phaedon cochleariae]
MESLDISHLADALRPVSRDICSGKGKLCLSANYLGKLWSIMETFTSPDVKSFHIVQGDQTRNNIIRDMQFLVELVENTVNLRIIPDLEDNYNDCLNIGRFHNIKVLEIYKLNINIVLGIQKLRSQVQELSCCKSIQSISDIIKKCGADNSEAYNWNELRIANFAQNSLVELDNSFEYTLSLNTLNLSHNNLTKLSFLNQLPNLKQLNLAYNKLEALPNFKGPITSRLQVLILNNNFIEDLAGLCTLSNISQLDIGHNCLLEHGSLFSLSHLVSLQWLNLQGNPISFHPQHRNLTSSYLNKNTSTVKFSLNGLALNKGEKNLTGSFHPMTQKMHILSTSNTSLDSSSESFQEKPRRIRNVIIEDENVIKQLEPVHIHSISTQHLEIKKQLEQLRREHGESWLYKHSGLIVQDVLGFESTAIQSSTPYETAINTLYSPNLDDLNTTELNHSEQSNAEVFMTAQDIILDNSSPDKDVSDTSDSEDVFLGGEESLFLAVNKSDNTEVFVVVTDSYISERDCTTSREKSRWHINTIISCKKDESNNVQLDFDTLRRDRKQRVYGLEATEIDGFFNILKDKMNTYQSNEDEKVSYQCMKCFQDFQMEKSQLLKINLTCPKCDSNLIVENM